MVADDRYTTLYLRNVPAALARKAKVTAARKGITLTAVVIDALARSLESGAAGGASFPASHEDELRDSTEWYKKNHERLLQRYRNEYVAIVDGAVVDHDVDFEALATRVFAARGAKPTFMPRVTEGAKPVRIRSPRQRAS